MKRMGWLALLVTIGLVAAGCGDDDGGTNDTNQNNANTNENSNQNTNTNQNSNTTPVLGDFDGFWELTSAAIPDGTGETTYTRVEAAVTHDGSSYQGMVRGYTLLTATDDTTGSADFAFNVIHDNVPTSMVNIDPDGTATLEPEANKLVFGFSNQIPDIVYLFERDGDTLTLTFDPNDVRNQDVIGQVATELVYTRRAVYTNELIGSYDYVSFTMDPDPGDPYTISRSCGAVGSSWMRLAGSVHVNAYGGAQGQLLQQTYDNDACSGTPTDTWSMTFFGFYDVDETAKTFLMLIHANETDRSGQLYDYVLSGSTLTLSNGMSFPPEGTGPTEVVLEKL